MGRWHYIIVLAMLGCDGSETSKPTDTASATSGDGQPDASTSGGSIAITTLGSGAPLAGSGKWGPFHSIETSAVTWEADSLLVLSVTRKSAMDVEMPNNLPAVANADLDFQHVALACMDHALCVGGARRIDAWYAVTSSAGSGTLVLTNPEGEADTSWEWSLVQYRGVDLTAPIARKVTGWPPGWSTEIVLDFGTPIAEGNVGVALFMVGCNVHTLDAPSESNAYVRTANSYLSHQHAEMAPGQTTARVTGFTANTNAESHGAFIGIELTGQ
jgi:hypothetical protein